MKYNKKMPVLFLGHGSPMTIIEENKWTDKWSELGRYIDKNYGRPKAILMISAHWFTRGTFIQIDEKPEMIYDMYGFPDPMYEYEYPAKTSPELISRVVELLGEDVSKASDRGYDHGAYSVLKYLYPNSDVPVVQLSIDGTQMGIYHLELAKKLDVLRSEGYLVIGSGNIVHNLRLVDWNLEDEGFDWAYDFDKIVKEKVLEKDIKGVANFENIEHRRYAAEYPDHFLPIVYALGAAGDYDEVEVFNEDFLMGALSMTSYIFK